MYSVSVNPWLRSALELSVRFVVVGMAWVWLVPDVILARGSRLRSMLLAGTFAALIGLAISLAAAGLLAEFGRYRPMLEWVILCGITLMGVICGVCMAWSRFVRNVALSLPALAFFLIGAAAVMLLPKQGEWIVGGWDPGTYVNQGVYAGRTGTFRPPIDPVYGRLTDEEFRAVTREVFNFTEALPVFPINPKTRSFEFLFFRLTPSVIAVAERCGGLRAATRVNLIVGLLTLLGFAGAVAALFRRRTEAMFVVLFLVVQPVWVYHLHIPTTEMLQLFLLCGVLTLMPWRKDSRFARVMIPALFLMMTVNRLDFLAFGGFLMAVLSWCDLEREDRSAVIAERISQLAALVAGGAFDAWTAAISFQRLGHEVWLLAACALLMVLVALALDTAAWKQSARLRLSRAATRIAVAGAVAGAVVLLAAAFAFRLPMLKEFRHNLVGIAPYFGWSHLIFAFLGAGIFVAAGNVVSREVKYILFFLAGSTVILLIRSNIAPWYPWMTRRYLIYSTPALAILGGYGAATLWGLARRAGFASRAAIGLLILAVLTGGGFKSYQAWAATEYNGLSEITAAIAARIDEKEDVVVADHFLFGVPLRFIHGRQVLNGERLVKTSGCCEIRETVAVLKRLSDSGRRIRFLTSTEKGMAIFPFKLEGLRKDWVSGPVVLRDIVHGQRQSGFKLRGVCHVFGLYTWRPGEATDVLSRLWGDSLDIDIGEGAGTPYEGMGDAAYLLQGFHKPELTTGGGTVRWTAANAVIGAYVAKPAADLEAVVRYMDAHRAKEAPCADPRFSFNGNPLQPVFGAGTNEADMKTASMVIPREFVGEFTNTLAVSCVPWVPADYLRTDDSRELGIMIDRVDIHPVLPSAAR